MVFMRILLLKILGKRFDFMFNKKLKRFIPVCAIASFVLCLTILFQNVSSMEIEILFVVLFFARALLASAVIVALLLILSGKGKLEENKMQKAAKISVSVVMAVFVLFTAIGFFTFRDTYTPEGLLESDTEYVKEIFPFIDLNVEPRENYDIYASHFPGTDIFTVKSINKNNKGTHTAYKCNYYKSDSMLMNLKLKASNNVYEYFNGPDFKKEKIKAGKFNVTVYSLEDRYMAKIDGFGNCLFLKLDKAEIDTKEFAELAVEQYILLQTASQSGMFLY